MDRHRNVRTVERRLERGRMLSRPGKEQRLLHLAVHGCAKCPAESAERPEERRHHVLAIHPIWQRTQPGESGLIELHGFAVGQRHRRVRKVGVRENAVDARRRAGKRSELGEKLLFAVGQRVRRAAGDVLQIEPVRRKFRLGAEELLHRSLREPEHFGFDVRRFRAQCRRELRHLSAHALVPGVACILVGKQPGVDGQARKLLIECVEFAERLGQRRGGRRELAFKPTQLRQLGLQPVLRRAPGSLRGVDIGEIPSVLLGDLRAVALLREALQRQRAEGGQDQERADRAVHRSRPA